MSLDRAASRVTSWSKPFSAQDYTCEETYTRTRAPVELATTLIPEAYTCPDFYVIEQERVFATSWIAVGCTSQLQASGQALVVTVAGRSIIVARDAWVLASGAGKEAALRESLSPTGATPLARVLQRRQHAKVLSDIK